MERQRQLENMSYVVYEFGRASKTKFYFFMVLEARNPRSSCGQD